MDANLKPFYSHPGKLLGEHLLRVRDGARLRGGSPAAQIAALFHDLGKINPNFQLKLSGAKPGGYSSHAYLSALAWLCFCQRDRARMREIIGNEDARVFSIAAMIARHHGDLPDLEQGFFKEKEQKALSAFLDDTRSADLPISDFLQTMLEHQSFDIKPPAPDLNNLIYKFPLGFQHVLPKVEDPLSFFMETQFGFASLIESDKRDAGNNSQFNKEKYRTYMSDTFPQRLEAHLHTLKPGRELDLLRTEMRLKSIESLRQGLEEGSRVFTLSAPTGAGKTLMLLSLAATILKGTPGLGVIYSLPFLSITEQTADVCRMVCSDKPEAVLRIDSKAENDEIDRIQRELDSNPSDENLKLLMQEIFSKDTFDHPFIITTFVQVFEALASNRNSTLLRLPNFAKAIFLIDEIQALPPRLYTFFTAYLDEFCRKFDSYAIVSTATMPFVDIPARDIPDEDDNPRKLFKRYSKPPELLGEMFFQHQVFNRYRISWLEPAAVRIEDLAKILCDEERSCLIILNTIDDTRVLYEQLEQRKGGSSECLVVLLNTHFTPADRRAKIELCKERLKGARQVLLVSTQLVEAGVDIDFPVVYRDLCPLPSVIQSAGRCNRNGDRTGGDVYLFEMKKANGSASAALVYGRDLGWFLDFTKENILGTVTERELFAIQQRFFQKVEHDLHIGLHKRAGGDDIRMVQCINHIAFEKLAKFRLIEERAELRYHVKDDGKFEALQEALAALKGRFDDYNEIKRRKAKVEEVLRQMANDIVGIRAKTDEDGPGYSAVAAGIRKLADPDDYSDVTGIKLPGHGGVII